jgi:hypothetical protein
MKTLRPIGETGRAALIFRWMVERQAYSLSPVVFRERIARRFSGGISPSFYAWREVSELYEAETGCFRIGPSPVVPR